MMFRDSLGEYQKWVETVFVTIRTTPFGSCIYVWKAVHIKTEDSILGFPFQNELLKYFSCKQVTDFLLNLQWIWL